MPPGIQALLSSALFMQVCWHMNGRKGIGNLQLIDENLALLVMIPVHAKKHAVLGCIFVESGACVGCQDTELTVINVS